MRQIQSVDGTKLSVHEQGPAEAPLIVLVHGLGLSARSWGTVPDALSDRYRVVAYDLRGHGHSGDAVGGDYRMEAHAEDLSAVLADSVPDGRRAVVVANSLGGGIVLFYAKRSGDDRLAAVVFAGSGGSAITLPGFPAKGVPEPAGEALSRWWLQAIRGTAVVAKRVSRVEPVANLLVRRFAFPPGEPPDAHAVARVRDDFFATRRRALARTTLASTRNNGLDHAAKLTVPTLVLHGTGDPEVPEDEARELVDRLPRGEMFDISGAGHMLALTCPDLVIDQVRRWAGDHLPT